MSSVKLNNETVNFKDIIKKEYQKCYTDPVYFMKKYCMIQHPQKGRMLFNLFPYQEDMLRDFQTYDYNIVLKSRQLGISTVAAGYSLWLMTFFSDKNILIIATKQDVAKNLVTKVRFMYQNLPSWLKEDFLEDNRLSLKLKNGSQVKATSSTEDAGRSEALSYLIIDECQVYETKILLMNTITGEVIEKEIGELYDESEELERNVKNNSKYTVMTPNGFSTFTGIKRVEKNVSIKFYISTERFIQSSENHRYLMSDNTFKYSKDVEVGDILFGNIEVLSKEVINRRISLYDLLNVSDGNIYYGDGVVSHNCAFINNNTVENIWTSAQQTLATGGGGLILSTPNGQGNFFHRMWVAAENGENGFNTIKLPWYVHPERNDEWRLKQDKLLGLKDAAQECLAGHHTVFVKDDNTGQEFNIRLDDLYKRVVENNFTYKILTPSGFQKFKTVKKTTKLEYLEIGLNNRQLILTCSKEHRFISNGNEVYAQDLRYKSILDAHDGNKAIVTSIKEYNSSEIDLYDIIEVDNGNLFIVDGIVSHNCDADFISSGATVIDPSDLDYYSKNFVIDPISRRGGQQELWIWEDPEPNSTYLVCADVARGDGGDYSAFHILNVLDNGLIKQVAEFKGKIDTDGFASLLMHISEEYNKALLVVENANVGWAVLTKLIDLKYENLYYSYKNDPFIDVSNQLKKGYDLKNNENLIPGFSTTSKTRPVMLERLEEYMREKTVIIQSKRTLQELQTFIWRNSRAEAMSGYNDDLVMSLSIGIWVRETALRIRQRGLSLTKSTLTGIRRSGVDSYQNKAKEYWTMPATGNNSRLSKEDRDLTWLIK